KSEARNPKQITMTESQNAQNATAMMQAFGTFEDLDFGLVSDFGFRVSSLAAARPPAGCREGWTVHAILQAV
ncbi:MAG TPA: hypothetical protein VNA25_20950, partial [Phycisphaerae bacterium]|nr:hypothetical protein [Phycisphaerae bacterium]